MVCHICHTKIKARASKKTALHRQFAASAQTRRFWRLGYQSAFALAYATIFEFTLEDGVITYRNRFRQDSFPVS